MGNGDDFKATYNKIRQRFIGKLQDSLLGFEVLEMDLQQGKLQGIDDIRMQVHKLVGSAKTFGFPELTDRAAYVEAHLDIVMSGVPLEEAVPSLQFALKEFLEEARNILVSDVAYAEDVSPQEADVVEEKQDALNPKDAASLPHILLVDDDELVCDLLKEGFIRRQSRVTVVHTGEEALAFLKECNAEGVCNRPSAIVLDAYMPGISGFDVLKTLKSNDMFKYIPVVMLTREDNDQNVVDSLLIGAQDYILKPFEVSTVVERVLKSAGGPALKVLIADEDEQVCDLLQQRLCRMGYTVLVAHDGKEVLACMNESHPDISILNRTMPGTEQFTSRFPEPEDARLNGGSQVLLFSANNGEQELVAGEENTLCEYIAGPFDPDAVAERVSGILRERKSA